MSIESPVPRTAVPLGITDPVESARAELKAALSAMPAPRPWLRPSSSLVERPRRALRKTSGNGRADAVVTSRAASASSPAPAAGGDDAAAVADGASQAS